MQIKRRKFLAIVGGGTILAASAGAVTFLTTRTPTKALAPWTQAGQYEEPRKRALSYAILAPNPHNRQPWLVDLSEDDVITLTADLDRLLPHTDPYGRQITIGLGCFLELLRMAAAQDGYMATIDEFPEGFDAEKLDTRPVAKVSFIKDPNVQKDSLFAFVFDRRSLKEPYDLERNVSDNVVSALENTVENGTVAGTTNNPEAVQQLRQLTRNALMIEIETPRTYKESVDLFRIGKSEINANPDGIDFGGPMFDTLGAIGMFSREVALDTGSLVYSQGIDAVMANVDTAMGFVWLTTNSNTRIDQLNAGRDWLRINLEATKQNIGIHPLSQALQEFTEMEGMFAQIHELLNAQDLTIQMLARLGYAADIPPSPRWPIDDKIIKA